MQSPLELHRSCTENLSRQKVRHAFKLEPILVGVGSAPNPTSNQESSTGQIPAKNPAAFLPFPPCEVTILWGAVKRMDTGSIVGIVGTIVTVAIAIYAILDVRGQVRQLILIERNISFSKVIQDFAWLFVEPTGTGHTREIAKGLEEFSMLAQVLDAAKTPAVSKSTVENESLAMAKDLVESGYARWKDDWDAGSCGEGIA